MTALPGSQAPRALTPAPTKTALRAGPLHLVHEEGDLRYIRFRGREVVRRIYAAVRDGTWGTVPGLRSEEVLEVQERSFALSYRSRHVEGPIDFEWGARISGDEAGRIVFEFDGEARSDFLRNRIGCCVLHPIVECAGARCRAHYVSGLTLDHVFPEDVEQAQPVPKLHDLAGISHEVEPGVWARLDFEGDIFEMEDQRNWIDASFKTFCTPLRIPHPLLIRKGSRVRQRITLTLVNEAGVALSDQASSPASQPLMARHEPRRVVVGAAKIGAVPALGLDWTGGETLLDETSLERLRRLPLDHLRVEVPIDREDTRILDAAVDTVRRLGVALELALLVAPNTGDLASWLVTLAERLSEVRLARVLLFSTQTHACVTASILDDARRVFDAPVGTGSNADLYQLQLNPPPAAGFDCLAWSMNPQVHAFDESSIVETPAAVGQQIATIRRRHPGLPLALGPITLRPRFNPHARQPEITPPGSLPFSVDPRHVTPFAAAWALAMVGELARAGADSATFFGTTGATGLMEHAGRVSWPGLVPTAPGQVFPLYHLFAALARRAPVFEIQVSHPLEFAAVAIQSEAGNRRVLVANLTAIAFEVDVSASTSAVARMDGKLALPPFGFAVTG